MQDTWNMHECQAELCIIPCHRERFPRLTDQARIAIGTYSSFLGPRNGLSTQNIIHAMPSRPKSSLRAVQMDATIGGRSYRRAIRASTIPSPFYTTLSQSCSLQQILTTGISRRFHWTLMNGTPSTPVYSLHGSCLPVQSNRDIGCATVIQVFRRRVG